MIAVALLACAPVEGTASGARWEGPFPVAELVEAGPVPRPASLDAPLPERSDGLGWDGMARARARAAFDPAALERVISWADGDPERFARALPPLDDAVCERLAGAAERQPDLAWYLAGCGDPAHAERFEASDAEAAVRWATVRGSSGPPPELGLRRAVEAARELGADDDVAALLAQLCETDRPDLAAGLRAVLEAPADPAERDALAAACPHQSDPVLAGAHARACRDGCASAPDALLDPDGAVGHPAVWAPGLLARHPAQREVLLAAVARCAGDVDHPFADHCLATLAREDWARARAVAAGRPPAAEPSLKALQAALAAYDEPRGLEERLAADGLLGTATGRRPAVAAVGAVALLRAHGRVVDLVEPGGAAAHVVAASDAWPGLAIQALPAPGGLEPRVALRAWDGDRRWHAWITPDDEVRGTAAFLNALLERRGSAFRVAIPAERTNALVFGPAEPLRALHDAGVLPLLGEEP